MRIGFTKSILVIMALGWSCEGDRGHSGHSGHNGQTSFSLTRYGITILFRFVR